MPPFNPVQWLEQTVMEETFIIFDGKRPHSPQFSCHQFFCLQIDEQRVLSGFSTYR